MAKRGRPVKGPALAEHVEASALARQRLLLILQTLAGALTIRQACQVLGIGRSRFCALRQQFLERAAGLLEPALPGRKPHSTSPAQLEIQRLRRQIVQLRLDLKATQVREEIALVLPHLLARKRDAGAGKKTRRRASPGPVRRTGSRASPKGTRGGSCASHR